MNRRDLLKALATLPLVVASAVPGLDVTDDHLVVLRGVKITGTSKLISELLERTKVTSIDCVQFVVTDNEPVKLPRRVKDVSGLICNHADGSWAKIGRMILH